MNAPINYVDHIAEANAAKEINHGRTYKHISDFGLFLKANSALVGFGDEVRLRFPDKRNDHELELAVIIGKRCNQVSRAEALNYVAGYALGLDMTVRGPEQTCWRKSVDTYAVLGPWLVTADEIANPNALELQLDLRHADGSIEARQKTNTRHMVFDVPRLIEYASSMYTLLPGDILLTGTPAGVGPVVPGDVMLCQIEGVAKAEMRVAAQYA
jgi:2-keto-4-pentenoate hydratase/2-oxohepta-3-ene-1,7-dioic acid hydratase in catechol pathway